MTDLLQTIPSLPTKSYSHLLPSLEKNFITTTDLLTLDSLEIAKRAQLPPLDVKRFVAHVLEALRAELGVEGIGKDDGGERRFENASKAGKERWAELRCEGEKLAERPWEAVRLGNEKLDQVLGGGLPTGYISEIVGESGAGKTQILLSLLLTAQLPSPHGLGRPALYVSTEHPLPTTRLTQLLRSNPTLSSQNRATRPTLANILSIQTPDLESQDHILAYQLPVALQRHNIGLVVIDSIAANYRAEKGSGKHAAALASRATQLIRLGALLRNLAREHNCAIVVANQVGDRFSSSQQLFPSSTGRSTATTSTQRSYPFSSSPPSTTTVANNTAPAPPVLSLDHQQRFFTGWGDSPYTKDNENLKTPSLGLTWANQIACRVALVKVPVFAQGSGSGAAVPGRESEGAEWAPRRWRRWMKMVFAPWAEPTKEGKKGSEFEIWAGGVRALAAEEKH